METRKKYWLHGHSKEVGPCRRNWNKKFGCRDGFNLKCFRAEPRQTPVFSLELRTQTSSVLIRCCFYKISISWNLLFLVRNQNCWGKLGTCDWKDWLLFSGCTDILWLLQNIENLPSFLLFWQQSHSWRRHHKELISLWFVLFLQWQKYL